MGMGRNLIGSLYFTSYLIAHTSYQRSDYKPNYRSPPEKGKSGQHRAMYR